MSQLKAFPLNHELIEVCETPDFKLVKVKADWSLLQEWVIPKMVKFFVALEE
jgi:hypothetical protein